MHLPTVPVTGEHGKKEINDVEIESKDSSQSGSIPGSEPLSRKQFLAVEFDGGKDRSVASSIQGSKGSLSSLSLAKGSKASLSSATPPKGSKTSLSSTNPLEERKESLSSNAPAKGSGASLDSSSVLQTEQALEPKESPNMSGELTSRKDLDLSAATNSSDFMALFQNW